MKRLSIFCLMTLTVLVQPSPSYGKGVSSDRCASIVEFVGQVEVGWTSVVCKSKTEAATGQRLKDGKEVLFRKGGRDLFVVVGSGSFRPGTFTGTKGAQRIEVVRFRGFLVETRAEAAIDTQKQLARDLKRNGFP